VTLLLHLLQVLVAAFLGQTTLQYQRGLATRFGDPGDHLSGKQLSCTHERMRPGQLVCAHRTLPCGTPLLLENPRNGRFAVCQVLDRGPFGAILPTGQWGVKIHRREPGAWRGILDLSPAVAKALAFNGRERVRVFYQRGAHHMHYGREREPHARP
jgi:rare lipoprotein A (peptidoglycan hydrolase)